MNLSDDDRQKIAEVLVTADGGCPFCATDLAEEMDEKFPGEEWRERVMNILHPPKDEQR